MPPVAGADLDGVAGGSIFDAALYVTNARHCDFPEPGTQHWITKDPVRPSE